MAKNRMKKNSIMNFVAVAVLTIIGIVLSVCSFEIPFTTSTYNGFANSIPLGFDLGGGIYAVYDCSLSTGSNTQDLDKAIDEMVERLPSVISEEYGEATITRQGSTSIRIEIPSTDDSGNFFELIGHPIYMALTNDDDAEARIVGTDIESATAVYQPTTDGTYGYGVNIQFTDEGADKFASLTAEAAESDNQQIYIFVGEIGGDDTQILTLTCEEEITGGSTFISFDTYEQAQEYALQIMSGTFDVSLDLLEQSVVSATLGPNALTFAIIGIAVGLVLIMLAMWIRYGDFGLLSAFALVIYLVLMLFFLQAIPFVQLTLLGLAGIILSIGMTVCGMVIIFEKFREEYRSGKKIPLSTKSAFKRAFWPIFDSNVVVFVIALMLSIIGTSAIQSFGIILLIGILLAMFTNLVVMRFFVKWYLPFNSVKAKKLHLPKQSRAHKELKESPVGGEANE